MPRVPRRLLTGIAAVVAAVACGSALRLPPREADAAPPGAPDPGPPFKLQGVASCAAAACHNGNGPRGSKGSEYTTWATADPHSRAYTALFDEPARRIPEHLNRHEPPEARRPAHENELCLRCHGVDPAQGPRWKEFKVDGVGCESCHGPAEKWKAVHYLPGWKDRSDREQLGFLDTKDLAVRAESCVACHVGSPNREVNHDLIAAGHPRLRFDLGAYLANYPKHWSDARDKAGRPALEAQVWAI